MKKAILSIVFLIASLGILRGQEMSTMGTDFWLTFMDNNNNYNLTVYISAPEACSVTLTHAGSEWTETASVSVGTVTSIEVPGDIGFSSFSGVVRNNGFHLTATDTVSVYIATQGSYTFDETLVLPTPVLRDKYVVQCYPSDTYGSEFIVLATQDSTWVDIYLTDSTLDGQSAGDTAHVFLPLAGKTYQLRSPDVGDFSGTRVEARDCKRIAVFHGNKCVYIPDELTGQSCDHVMEQAIPVNCWGKEFIVVSSGSLAYPDRVRITALEDGCVVRKNGQQVATLNALQTYEYRMNSTVWRFAVDYILTSTQASVNVYFASTGQGIGDPSMVTVSPLDQAVKNITFNSSSTSATNTHYVNVVVRGQDIPYLRLDGNTLMGTFTMVENNPAFFYRAIELNEGSHTLRMVGGAGFVAYAFGMGTHESYAYTIGSNMIDLSSRMVVNGITINQMSNLVFCRGSEIPMYIEGADTGATFYWDFGDSTFSTNESVTHSYSQAGNYTITAVISAATTPCFPTNDTLRTTIRIVDPDTVNITFSTCDPIFVWQGDTCRESGTYEKLSTNRYGCDSLTVLNLSMHHASQYYIPMEGCDSLILNDHIYWKDDTAAMGVYTDRWGCDSIVVAQIVIHPVVHTVQDVHISYGDTLHWIDGLDYSEETDEPFIVLRSIHGCDSIIHLHLHLVEGIQPPPIDSAVIWVPNVFTPEESTNKEFVIKSNDITYMHVYLFTRGGAFVTDFDGLTECWDGRRNGEMCKSEAYVYLIEYTTKGKPGYKQRMTGTVLLLR